MGLLPIWIFLGFSIVVSVITRDRKEEDNAKAMERYIKECNKEEEK